MTTLLLKGALSSQAIKESANTLRVLPRKAKIGSYLKFTGILLLVAKTFTTGLKL